WCALRVSTILTVYNYREALLHSEREPHSGTLKVLEPYDGKLSRTVLRGGRGSKAPTYPVRRNVY
ncbi:hypothetical protein MJD09_25845, partial [bacterium]|nr:hypothetical protein [bacterium]